MKSQGHLPLFTRCLEVLFVVVAFFLTACSESHQREDGEFVTLVYAKGHAPCPGNVAFLDEAYRGFAEVMGLFPDAPGLQYHYGLEPGGVCVEGPPGCVTPDGTELWSSEWYDPHLFPLAMLLQKVEGRGHFFPVVGVAHAFFINLDITRTDYGIISYAELDASVGARSWSEVDPALAADLIAYLLRTRGFGVIEAWLLATTPESSPDEVRQAFQAALGQDLSAVVAERVDSKMYIYRGEVAPVECLFRPSSFDERAFRWELHPTCEAEGMVGDESEIGAQYTRAISVELPSDGVYLARIAGSGRSVPTVSLLSACDEPLFFAPWATTIKAEAEGDALVFAERRAGVHVVRANVQEGSNLVVEVERTDAAARDGCGELVVVGREVREIHLRAGPLEESFAAFVLDSAVSVSYAASGFEGLSTCTGACEELDCVALTSEGSGEIELEPGLVVLRYDAVVDDERESVASLTLGWD